jgi:flagellin-like protein
MKLLTKERKKRSAVSPVIATLLLIAIAVAAAIIVYAFVTGLIGGLSSGSGSSLIPVTATLIVPTGTATGTLAVTVQNNANNPVTGITVAFNGITDSFGNTCLGENAGTAAGTTFCGAYGAVLAASLVAGACPVGPQAANVPDLFCNGALSTVFATNPLPVGSTVSTAAPVKSGASVLQSGTTYSFTVVVSFANGSTKTQIISATAEL